MPRKQQDIGLGQPGSSTRVVSPPSGQGSITFDVIETPQAPSSSRKRKFSSLTPDNAEVVLSSCLDMNYLFQCLNDDPDILLDRDEDALIATMSQCVKDPKNVGFSSVTQRHLNLLGLNVVLDLELDQSLVDKVNHIDSAPNKMIQKDYLSSFHKHFNVSKESGCRCIIDQYLITAIVYAQNIIDTDPEIMKRISKRCGMKQPHLAVFTEHLILPTRITHNDTFYVFHGYLDYGIGFIKGRDVASLQRGSLRLDPAEMLIGILEAKSLSEMQNAQGQITVQVLTMLTSTGRNYFTGALTNGALWRFYVARLKNYQLQVFSSTELTEEKDQGLIIELLKDMMLYEISPLFNIDQEWGQL